MDSTDSTLEILSPELALVSPELGERARAALPDRPWELFAPPVEGAAPRVRPTVRPESAWLRTRPADAGPPRAATRQAGRESRRTAREAGRGRKLQRAALSALVAAWVAMTMLAFLPPRDAPRLIEPESPPTVPAPAAAP